MEKYIKRILAVVFVGLFCFSGFLTLITGYKNIGAAFVNGMNNGKPTGVLNKVEDGIKAAENSVNESFLFRNMYVNIHGLAQRAMGKNVIDDVDESYTVLKLRNGYLTFLEKEPADYSDFCDFMKDLSVVCENNNSKLIYVNKLDKNTGVADTYPEKFPYLYTDDKKYMDDLRNMDIGVLDLEDNLAQQSKDVYSMFFKTDHHWTPQAGIWTSRQIVDYLNLQYGYDFDGNLYSEENFNVEVYANSFLGSQGKRVGRFYGGIDDFYIVTPKYTTDYSLEIPKSNIYRKGDFEDTMLFRERFTPEDIMNQDTTAYQVYMRGNHEYVTINNYVSKSDKKALVIMDSYGCVVAPYLCQSFSRLDCIDLRHFEGVLYEYIKEMSPDVVICMTTAFEAE